MSTVNEVVEDIGQELPLLLSVKQGAALCGLGISTWWRLLASGKAPKPPKIGGSVRWPRDEIFAWVAAGCPARAKWEQVKKSL